MGKGDFQVEEVCYPEMAAQQRGEGSGGGVTEDKCVCIYVHVI